MYVTECKYTLNIVDDLNRLPDYAHGLSMTFLGVPIFLASICGRINLAEQCQFITHYRRRIFVSNSA